MNASQTTTPPQVPDRFANAPVLPFDRGAQWFARGRSMAWQAPFFLLFATLLTLVGRWQLDWFGTGNLIVLSYLTDAVVFTWVFLGLAARAADPSASAFRSGQQALQGRWWVVAVCSLWGLPAALVSHAMFAFAPELIKALVLVVGSNWAGLAALLVVIMAAAYATFLLSMLPVLAAIQAGRDAQATFKVAGLWALRALRAGRRPLAAVFVTFISGCMVAGAGLTYLYGHLPVQWLLQDPGLDALLRYWYPWPGLWVALFVFLAMLQPMASDLLTAADVDLSDEILSHEHKAAYGDRHVGWLLRRAGFALRSLAALSILLSVMYGAVLGSEDATAWLVAALVLYGVGQLCTRWGNRRQQQALALTSAQPVPTGVARWATVADTLLAVVQWLSLLLALGWSLVVWVLETASDGHFQGGWGALPYAVPLVCWALRRWWIGRWRVV